QKFKSSNAHQMFAAQRLCLRAVLFYVAKPKRHRSTQGHLNNASNHPNRARSRFCADENTPTKAKTAPTTPAITTIGLGWTSQPHLIDLPIIRSNTFPKK
ncbi:hypothetical protein, partial [Parolsenella catena]|uniref:hypothetical protein n=1 Tax=Parolsenella catena TaxID=2003188 RepID=UPI002FDE5CF4